MTVHNYSFAGGTVNRAVDHAKLSEAILLHGQMLGVGNMIRDTIAGMKQADYASKDAWVAAVTKVIDEKIADLYAGELRSFGGKTGNPVETRTNAFAKKQAVAALKGKYKRVADIPEAEIAAAVEKLLTANGEAWRAMFKAQVEQEQAAVADVEAVMAG
ncbi:MAG TPA: hypothetical protein VFV92_01120 [Candidatus Bathyarchaeia archaeon]|nr:hypothetical protein [Candidatus Bathyarchaeia archaeon]